MKASVKKSIKFAAGVCAALGMVTIGAVVASGAAVKVVAESLKAGMETMKKQWLSFTPLRIRQVS